MIATRQPVLLDCGLCEVSGEKMGRCSSVDADHD